MTARPAADPALAELAAECGVATRYTDAHGVEHQVSAPTLRAVLAAMGVGAAPLAATDRDVLEELRLRPWRRVLPPTVVARAGTPASVALHLPLPSTQPSVTPTLPRVSVHVELEDGSDRLSVPLPPLGDAATADEIRSVDGQQIARWHIELPDSLPPGWHRLVVVTNSPAPPGASPAPPRDSPARPGASPSPPGATTATATATLLVAPDRIPVPGDLDRRRAVGLAAQLYQVRSAGSWGMGDLTDLATLADWAGREHGADFVLVNPMHAGEPYPPVSPSPYLPTTRRFASPLYLRPEAIVEFAELPSADLVRVTELAASARALNGDDTIDRDASWTAKLEALRLIAAVPLRPYRADAFDAFRDEQGDELRRFATWCAIARDHGTAWTHWPADLRDPLSPAVARFADEHADEIRFQEWLQWQVAQQRADAQRTALDSGMRLGVIHDLAVGVHPEGADAWALHRSLARGVSVGAPPDIYNQRGQDWSQPPLRPDALAEEGYATLRDIVRAALRDAGGVRIDHILGMFRLWWIPEGRPPTEGTYVTYDAEAMLSVLALEAWRAGAVVIGEDLGTVAPGVREALEERGVLGTNVLWFEQGPEHLPTPPEEYRRSCMASVVTHDLPPTAGYVELRHVDIREQLGLLNDPAAERQGALAEVSAFAAELDRRGLLGAGRAGGTGGGTTEAITVGLHALLAASPSLLVAVSVADLVADRRPVNIPGTSEEYPNWRVPLSGPDGRVLSLEEVCADPLADRVMRAARDGRV